MNDPEARLQDAIAAHRRGDVAVAEPVYRDILAGNPDHAEARHMMAHVYAGKGRFDEAEREVRRALACAGEIAKYHNTLGYVLGAQERWAEALAAFDAALALEPGSTQAAYNKGTVLLSLGRRREAEEMFRTALRRGADEPALFNNLAAALIKQNRIREALECCRDGLARHPDNAPLLTAMASALEMSNDLPAAEEAARRAIAAAPDSAMARLILARVLRRKGELDAALRTIGPALERPLNPVEEAEVCYEKGLIQDARGCYGEAFGLFARNNALRSRSPEAARRNGDRYLGQVRAYRAWIERRARPEPAPGRGDGKAPVFFVGFPRSGTTLMEQILKAHPDIVTTEETSPLGPVKVQAARLAARMGRPYPDCLDEWDEETRAGLRELFRRESEKMAGAGSARVLVDKLPLNIVDLGLAAALWPDARILVALRDPRDACLSCFTQRFALNDAMVNFLDLERTATLYAEVMGLWELYRERLGLPFLEYRYEDLIEDFESVVRRVLEFIGVGWCDAVAQYRDAAEKRIIRTPSYRDVTAPIHDRAVQRWRNYESELAPILPRLAPFARRFGYEAP